jgi:hypothetical protein
VRAFCPRVSCAICWTVKWGEEALDDVGFVVLQHDNSDRILVRLCPTGIKSEEYDSFLANTDPQAFHHGSFEVQHANAEPNPPAFSRLSNLDLQSHNNGLCQEIGSTRRISGQEGGHSVRMWFEPMNKQERLLPSPPQDGFRCASLGNEIWHDTVMGKLELRQSMEQKN